LAIFHWRGVGVSPQWMPPKKERVAIIGGGPAGLSAAYHLRLEGYTVEIYEARQKLGGLLRYGIPAYRLPKEVLDREIDRLLELGIEVHTDVAINTPGEYDRLQKEYDALFISTGAQRSRKLAQFEDSSGIIQDGLDYLYNVNSGQAPGLGQKVLVIGGGNTAIDTARSAKRLGADQVMIIYRRTEEEMPSQKSEILEAGEEGILFTFLASPVRIEKENGVQKLVCQKMQLGENDSSGRPRPEPIKDAYLSFEADSMIMALGSDIVMPKIGNGLEIQDSVLKVDGKQETSIKNVFAGGDLTSNIRFVSTAMGVGKKAAQQMAQLFGGNTVQGSSDPETVSFEEINTFYFPRNPAVVSGSFQLVVSDRIKNFEEVQLGISEEQAIGEATRCFNCGFCTVCDNCYYFCPDMAIARNSGEDGPNYTVLDQYCKGCGLCVRECPRGAIVLKEESK
jgi:NADPH-dependent glutamate synthase beta subunit-like oxidoreductase